MATNSSPRHDRDPQDDRADRLADLVSRARASATTTTPPGLHLPEDLPLAYRVQDEVTRRRTADGAVLCGWKVGAANARQQAELGPAIAPTRGALFQESLVPAGATVDGLTAPKVEPEIGFVLAHDLYHPVRDLAEALAAVARAVAVIEVVDTIWAPGATLADGVADNASAGWVVVGADLPIDLGDELLALEVELYVDGVAVGRERTPAAGWAHPADALVALARRLAETGRHLQAGQLVISGGICAPVDLLPVSTVSARFGRLAEVAVSRR